MKPSDFDFGTVPAWLTALIAGLSFALAWYTVRATAKDRKRNASKEVRRAAEQVTVTPIRNAKAGEGKVRVITRARNDSDLPITDVWVSVHSKLLREPAFTAQRYLDPNEVLDLDEIANAAPDPFPADGDDNRLATVTFTDAKGYRWQRWADGDLKPVIDLCASDSSAARWIVVHTPIGRIAMKRRRRQNRPPVHMRRPGAK